jgi:hypothetical protein
VTATITRVPAVAPIVPDLFQGYETTQTTRTTVFPLIGQAAPAYTLKDAGYRTGSMTMVFRDRAAAHAARTAHAAAGVFTLTDTDVPEASMVYVVVGAVRIAVDPTTGAAWLVTVDFQEVAG